MTENIRITSALPSTAAQVMDLKAEMVNTAVDVRLLKDTLDFERKISADLLKSLGIGQLLDVIV